MKSWILDALWPRTCPVCGRPGDRPGRHVCSECLNRVPFAPADGCCSVCGRAVEGLRGEYLCEECSGRDRPAFDRAGGAVRYEAEVRELVNRYKSHDWLWLRDDFVDWLEASARARFDVEAVDVVVPMPSSALHRVLRGYNQCVYLAQGLAERLGRRCECSALRRRRGLLLRRQAGLSEEERRENAKDSFAVRRPASVRGRTVLVVDDIMTTGATLSDCARALKEAGAWRVWCQALARSVRS